MSHYSCFTPFFLSSHPVFTSPTVCNRFAAGTVYAYASGHGARHALAPHGHSCPHVATGEWSGKGLSVLGSLHCEASTPTCVIVQEKHLCPHKKSKLQLIGYVYLPGVKGEGDGIIL